MRKPLEGIKVVEVAMWAFVPAAGGILSDMGASVIKIEPPTGDPLRGLRMQGAGAVNGFDMSWEAYNRGKRSLALDLRVEGALDVLHKLVEEADVFLTSLLPPARRKMKIDIDDIRARNPKIIYAVGSGSGRQGPDADKGGYDAITFWARGAISLAVTPDDSYPAQPPGPAYGDTTSAAMLAGGVAAAIAQRALTGHASVVDVSLLSAATWSMQRTIMQASAPGAQRMPRPKREDMQNPLVNMYKTSDGRFLYLCMLQSQRYWADFCKVAERPDLGADPRFATDEGRAKHHKECIAALDALFATHTLAKWKEILGRQVGPWDVVQHAGEIKDDPQVKANGYMQTVNYSDGRSLAMMSVPMQFDGAPLPARPAPELGNDSDAVLGELGYDEDEIINLKVAGVVL